MVDPKKEFWMAEVFVSHTSVDTPYCRARVLPAIKAVVERGFNQYVFMNWNNFGNLTGESARMFASGYVKEITSLIRGSRSLLVVLSKAAIASKWVAWEVNWWITHRSIEKILVVLSEKCNPLDLDSRLDKVRSIFVPNINNADIQASLQAELKMLLK